MHTLIVNCTRFGDLLQTQPVISGLKARGGSIGLVCLENFVKAAGLLDGVDAVHPLPGAGLLARIKDSTISGKIAKEVFSEMVKSGDDPETIVSRKGLKQISDSGELEAIIDEIIKANPDKAEAYRNGKTGLIGFFVGQVMQQTRGQANPQVVNQLLREKL